MVKLVPGTLLKHVEALNTGNHKIMREQRRSVLQVIDILPANLDSNDLLPSHGFYIKLSDSSHSLYVSVPVDQDDLILSNEMQLGQFIYVDRLEPGSPVPVVRGAKPMPGRQPLIGSPQPIVQIAEGPPRSLGRQRRASWGPGLNVTICPSSSPIVTDFESSVMTNGGRRKEGCSLAVSTAKMAADLKNEGSSVTRKRCPSPKISRSKICPAPDLQSSKSSFSTVATKDWGSVRREQRRSSTPNRTGSIIPIENAATKNWGSVSREQRRSSTPNRTGSIQSLKESSVLDIPLYGKLNALRKEAIQQKEAAQDVANEAMRVASIAETVIQALKVLSELSVAARPDDPTNCFDRFLSFHQEITKAVRNIETIQSAKTIQTGVCGEGKALTSSLNSSMSVAKQIQTESEYWFVNFLEKALEVGLKVTRGSSGSIQKRGWCSESLILEVVNWAEAEQTDCRNRPAHRKAAQVARKLRMEVRNQLWI